MEVWSIQYPVRVLSYFPGLFTCFSLDRQINDALILIDEGIVEVIGEGLLRSLILQHLRGKERLERRLFLLIFLLFGFHLVLGDAELFLA